MSDKDAEEIGALFRRASESSGWRPIEDTKVIEGTVTDKRKFSRIISPSRNAREAKPFEGKKQYA